LLGQLHDGDAAVAQYALVAGGRTLKVLEMNPRFIDQSLRGEVFASAVPEDVVVLAE
jgi:iron(III) transport system ATP-binding protein